MEIPEHLRRTRRQQEIIICHRCNGEGYVDVYNEDPRYEGPWRLRCPECEGHGRVVRILTTQYEVIKTENKLIYL